MATETIAYKCDFCGRLCKSLSGCKNHERVCFKNPLNQRACLGCAFSDKIDVTTTFFGYNGFCEVQSEDIVNVFYCIKRNACLIPPKRERIGEYYDNLRINGVEVENVFMPHECSLKQ